MAKAEVVAAAKAKLDQAQDDALNGLYDAAVASVPTTGISQDVVDGLNAKMAALQIDDDKQKAIIQHIKEALG